MSDEKNFEYRVCWSASTNISFKGESDWMDYGAEAENAKEVEDDLMRGEGMVSEAMDAVLNASGFEWWLEVREVGDE